MSSSVLTEERVRTNPATARPYILGGLAALSAGAAAIHFAVMFDHFSQYVLYGVFFLVVSWAQAIWAAVVMWRPSRLWLGLGIAGNVVVLAVYLASRTTGLPIGPDVHAPEPVGGLDIVSGIVELALVAGCAALLWRPALAGRPVRRLTGAAGIAARLAGPAVVIAAVTAVMTPALAGPGGPAGMTSSSGTSGSSGTTASGSGGMPGMSSIDGHPEMRVYGSTAPPTAAQVIAAGQLIKATDASLARYRNVRAAYAAGYTYVLRTHGEEHLLYDGGNPAYAGLDPRHPSSLVYATDVPHHAPVLLGAMYIESGGRSGPQVGGSLTRWHSHLVVCRGGSRIVAGFGVRLRDHCDPATWQDRYTDQMLHVWVVRYPGGPFSDDLSSAATRAAARAALGQAHWPPPDRRPGGG